MTADEFAPAAQILDGAWPGEFTDAEEGAYVFLLGDFTAEQVMAAIKALRRSRFRPAASEIVEAIEGTKAARPTFDEALRLIFAHGGVLSAQPPPRGMWIGDSRRVARDAARAARMAMLPPLVASFVHRVTFGRLDHIDLENEWHRKEMREAWEAHVAAQDGRELSALVARSGRGELGRLNPLAALTEGEAA